MGKKAEAESGGSNSIAKPSKILPEVKMQPADERKPKPIDKLPRLVPEKTTTQK